MTQLLSVLGECRPYSGPGFLGTPSSRAMTRDQEGGHGEEDGPDPQFTTECDRIGIPESWSVQRKQEFVLRLLRGEHHHRGNHSRMA